MASCYRRYICCLSIGLFLALMWGPPRSVSAEETPLDEMIQVIRHCELTEFLEAIEGHQWAAPQMFSRWHVEHVAPEDTRPDMLAARAFGKTLLDRLTDWKTAMTASATPDAFEHQIDAWLALADWLMKENGYGNVFVAVRCHDIATIGLGQLLVNLEYPFEQINHRIHRLDAPWYAPSSRRALLNREAGAALFAVDETEEQAIQRELEQTWQCGMFAADRERKRQESPDGNARVWNRDMMVMQALITVTLLKSPAIPKEHLSFFEDDPLPYPPIITTASMWENKWHEKCVVGFEFRNASRLKALALFREKVGDFPTTYEISEEKRQQEEALVEEYRKKGITLVDAFDSPAEAAFHQAWQPFATEETRYLDDIALNTYNDITAGRFLDQDTLTELQSPQFSPR